MEIKRGATDPDAFTGGLHRSKYLSLESSQDVGVDRRFRPRPIFHLRQGRFMNRLECPKLSLRRTDDVFLRFGGRLVLLVFGPVSACVNPTAKIGNLLLRQFPLRRHLDSRMGVTESLDQKALVCSTRNNGGT